MDISADKYKSDENHRSGPFLAVSQTVRGIAKWLAGFFKVTEEDLAEAGIFLGGEGCD
jgi:hypothetical protein